MWESIQQFGETFLSTGYSLEVYTIGVSIMVNI